MLHRERLKPPKYVYPPHEWKFIEKDFYPRFLAQSETMFSLGNGYIGMRGNFDEGRPTFENGTFVNGFYESWPIVYGEEAYGFAQTGQTIVNVPDTKIIRLYVDDEPFYLPTADLISFERVLDMKNGILDREILWETPAGKRVSIKSRRLVSLEHRHLAAISYEVTIHNAKAPVVLSSKLVNQQGEVKDEGDPRRARGFRDRVLLPMVNYEENQRIIIGYQTNNSKMTLACGVEHVVETECPYSFKRETSEDSGKVVLSIEAKPDLPIQLTKYITYHSSRSAPPKELCGRAERTLDRAKEQGFPALLEGQRRCLDGFWKRSDVQVYVDPSRRRRTREEWQQAVS